MALSEEEAKASAYREMMLARARYRAEAHRALAGDHSLWLGLVARTKALMGIRIVDSEGRQR